MQIFVLNFCTVFSASSRFMGAEGGGASGRGGPGAMDIGNRRGATLAAGLISGIGSLGPIVQELVIGRLYDGCGGDLSGVFLLLLLSAVAATLMMAVAVARNRLGHARL